MAGGPIGLGEAERVRGELAARIRLPGWYVVLYAAAMAVVFGAPGLLGERLALLLPLQLLAAVVLSSIVPVLGRAGVTLRADTWRAYPSMRLWLLALAGPIGLGTAGVVAAALVGNPWWGAAVALLTGVACALLIRRAVLGVAEDVRAGRVASQ